MYKGPFTQARELFYVPPGGRVVDIGFSLEDILRLGCVASSGSCLCLVGPGEKTLVS